MKPWALSLATILLASLISPAASAHEARPGYLELRETRADRYEILWKQPAKGDYALRITPVFPPECTLGAAAERTLITGALLSRFSLECPHGLAGKSITIDGLQATLTDVLVRVHARSGVQETFLLRPSAPVLTLGGDSNAGRGSSSYLVLGIEHILTAIDHLLFILALLLIVQSRWMVVKTLTAFTIAHSITLAAAALGWIKVPGPPVEASIALSILFLAREVMCARQGQRSLVVREPWLVAFAFGLLHGCGFAGAFASMGLPATEIPWALLLFNCGVELGQLVFVLAIVGSAFLLQRLPLQWPNRIRAIPAYAIGTMSAWWFFERIAVYFNAAVRHGV